MSTVKQLLKKIELDLEKVIENANSDDEVAVYSNTLDRLRELNNDSSGVEISGDSAAQYERVFAECYHILLELEKSRTLTTNAAPLLNDLDEFEDYLIGK